MRATWAAAGVRAQGLMVVLMVALMLGLAGCGGSSSSEAEDTPTGPTGPTTSPSGGSTTPTPSDAPSPTEEEGCPYLTAPQVTAALGTPTRETAGSMHACFFDPEMGVGPSVMLSRVNVQIDPAEYAAQTKALCEGEVTDLELGDEAFACVMGLGPQGQLYSGRVLVTVNVHGAVDDAAGIATAAKLLRDVTIPALS